MEQLYDSIVALKYHSRSLSPNKIRLLQKVLEKGKIDESNYVQLLDVFEGRYDLKTNSLCLQVQVNIQESKQDINIVFPSLVGLLNSQLAKINEPAMRQKAYEEPVSTSVGVQIA